MSVLSADRWLISPLFVAFLLTSSCYVYADRNKYFHISSLCVGERNYPQYKIVHGAVLTSEGENDLECVITFQTDSILQKFMIRFERLALDCNDHLVIFDGAHAIGKSKVDLSCRSTRADVGKIFTQSNYVTFKYTTDSWSQPGNGFKLVITAFKDVSNPELRTEIRCTGFECGNSFCIAPELKCDSIDHCGDNSDESAAIAACLVDGGAEGGTPPRIMGVGVSLFITALLVLFVMCLVCVVALVVCVCRKGPPPTMGSAHHPQFGPGPPMHGGPGGMPPLSSTSMPMMTLNYHQKRASDDMIGGTNHHPIHATSLLHNMDSSTFPLRQKQTSSIGLNHHPEPGQNWLV